MDSEAKITSLYPKITISASLDYEEATSDAMPEVTILGSESVLYRHIELDCADADIRITNCSVDILRCSANDKYFRAVRIKALNGLRVREKVHECDSFSSKNYSIAPKFLSVKDSGGTKLYLIDHWYDSGEQVKSRQTLEMRPDFLLILHLIGCQFSGSGSN